jgi:hypothetical protein
MEKSEGRKSRATVPLIYFVTKTIQRNGKRPIITQRSETAQYHYLGVPDPLYLLRIRTRPPF